MLFYRDKNSPRLEYMLDLFSNEIFNEPFRKTSDKSAFIDYSGTKLNYSECRLSEQEFYIQPHQLLFESSIGEQTITRFDSSGKPAFFQTAGDFPFDIFAAAFYLVSRYEEYLSFEPDKYGRFPHEASLAFRESFLEMPLINYWLEDFKHALHLRFPDLPILINIKGSKETWEVYAGLLLKVNGLIFWIVGMYFSIRKKTPLIPMNGLIHCICIAEPGLTISSCWQKSKPGQIKTYHRINRKCNHSSHITQEVIPLEFTHHGKVVMKKRC